MIFCNKPELKLENVKKSSFYKINIEKRATQHMNIIIFNNSSFIICYKIGQIANFESIITDDY